MISATLRALLITMTLMISPTDLLDIRSDQHVPSTNRDTSDSSAHDDDDDDDHRLDAVDGQLHNRKNTFVRPWIIGANGPGRLFIAGAAMD